MSDESGKTKAAILIFLIFVITFFHFSIPTEDHTSHMVHIILRKLYFLPPVMAAAWFGLKGATLVTSVISVAFLSHAVLDWPGDYMEQANQFGELATFWVVGLVPGVLFDRQKALLQDLAKSQEETLLALVSSLDLRGKNTPLHSQRVREYTVLLAERAGVSEKEKKSISLGALLHDVGKISVPDTLFLKHAGYSPEELKIFRAHPEKGYRLLQKIGFLRDAAEIVLTHQERYDGSGYPRGLKGEEIPWGARLFMVAEIFDELTGYHAGLDYDHATEMIRKKSGSWLDPAAVEIFINITPAEWERVRNQYPPT
ncbi:HD-GYP domain-containing protein [Geobacter sp. DSM 9736]|uniref:HD-GYP domain-containing protein n=1 Tax=Geobacter sp. DSM 9736 TaxID=1277350 RepID=UPI000B504C1B|nr:HD domain-containing phosphohydrolase [Geobacter sp. DSM 9736]SNB45388.1 HDIG domain-containing protein [Geobacter sp. DSM 9736]